MHRNMKFSSPYSASFILVLALLVPFRPAVASDQVENIGDTLCVMIPAITYGTTFYLQDSEGRKQFYESFFTNLGVTYALKKSISKTRPNGTDNDSFPSAHSSMALVSASSGRIASNYYSGDLNEVQHVSSRHIFSYDFYGYPGRGVGDGGGARH
jgi:hypothetical protein